MTNDAALREKFEAKFMLRMHNMNGLSRVDIAWLAWQASAEEERGRVIEECAETVQKLIPGPSSENEGRAFCYGYDTGCLDAVEAIRALNRTAAQQEKPE